MTVHRFLRFRQLEVRMERLFLQLVGTFQGRYWPAHPCRKKAALEDNFAKNLVFRNCTMSYSDIHGVEGKIVVMHAIDRNGGSRYR